MVNLFTVYVLNTVWSMMSDERYDRKSAEIDDLLKMFFELFQHVDMVGAIIQSLSHNEFYSTLRVIMLSWKTTNVSTDFCAKTEKIIEKHNLIMFNYGIIKFHAF